MSYLCHSGRDIVQNMDGVTFAFVSASSHNGTSSSIKGSVIMAFISGSIVFHFFVASLTTSFALSCCPAGRSGITFKNDSVEYCSAAYLYSVFSVPGAGMCSIVMAFDVPVPTVCAVVSLVHSIESCAHQSFREAVWLCG